MTAKYISLAATLVVVSGLLHGCGKQPAESGDNGNGTCVIEYIDEVYEFESGSKKNVTYVMVYDDNGNLLSDQWHNYTYDGDKIILMTDAWLSDMTLEAGKVCKNTVCNPRTGEAMYEQSVSYDEHDCIASITWGDDYGEYYEWSEGDMVNYSERRAGYEGSISVEYTDIANEFNLDLASFLSIGRFSTILGTNGLACLTGAKPKNLPSACRYTDFNGTVLLAGYDYETDSAGRPVKVRYTNPENESCKEVYFAIKYKVFK